MAQSRRSGYEDRSTPQLRSELLNIAERATTSQREIRALVRIAAELAARLERMEAGAAPEEDASETAPAAAASVRATMMAAATAGD